MKLAAEAADALAADDRYSEEDVQPVRAFVAKHGRGSSRRRP